KPGGLRDRQRLVGAGEKLDRHKDQLGVADVLEIMHFELAWTVSLVTGLAGLIGVFDGRAVHQMLASPPAGYRCPEIVEDVAMEAEALARLQADRPDPEPLILRYQLVANAAIRAFALARKFIFQRFRPFGLLAARGSLINHAHCARHDFLRW